jgi:hypothetical protein
VGRLVRVSRPPSFVSRAPSREQSYRPTVGFLDKVTNRLQATGRRFELPFACVWRVTGGLLAEERFFFDLHQMCEQLELDTGAVMDEIRTVSQAQHAAPPLHES